MPGGYQIVHMLNNYVVMNSIERFKNQKDLNKVYLINIDAERKISIVCFFLERARASEAGEKENSGGDVPNANLLPNSRRLLIPDESTLSRLVAARLDFP